MFFTPDPEVKFRGQMKFQRTELDGVWIIELEKKSDDRGFLARVWCRDEFETNGLNPYVNQCSIVANHKKNTLRGLHFQRDPYGEVKTVFCFRGTIYDVVVDLRPHSKTYCKWSAFELSEQIPRILYIPEGIAHGYQTLSEHSEIYYQMNVPFKAEAAWGVRWNDPMFQIKWPKAKERMICEKDQRWPDFVSNRIATHASL